MSRHALRITQFARRGAQVRLASTTAGSGARGRARGPLVLGGAAAFLLAAYVLSERNVQSDARTKTKVKGKSGLIPYSEVQRHSAEDDCWVVLHGKVYDLTKFAEIHPGGAGPIYRLAGHDATAIFAPLHSPGIIEDRLDPAAYVGDVDPKTLPAQPVPAAVAKEERERIPLEEIVGLPDFELAAERNMTEKAWAFISAAATDLHSLGLNRRAWNDVLFRPRTLVAVAEVDTTTTMMGQKTSVPFFICPTGMSKMAGAEGEPGIADAAAEHDVIQMVSTNSSAPLEVIVSGRAEKQVQFMQLYVDRKRENSEALLRKVKDLGMKAVFVTVDAAAPGKREADERSRAAVQMQSGIGGDRPQVDKKGGGIGRTTGQFIDPTLNWDDIAWLRKSTPLPLGVKGIQCVEDAVRAAEMGVDAIYLSNHGGRALDTSPPALYTLLELRRLRPDVFEKCEVYVDGGVRRGTDVIKALCLGARGVGMARPFLYALTYGTEGVSHAIEIMKDEIEVTMKLLGVTKLNQLGPHLLNTRALDSKIIDALHYGPNEFVPSTQRK